MSTFNIDPKTRKSKFASYSDGDLVEVEFTGTISGNTITADEASIECSACMEEGEEESPASPASKAAISKPMAARKKMPKGMMNEEEEVE